MLSLLLPLTLLVQSSFAAENYITSNNTTPKDNNPNCTCYVVDTAKNSKVPTYFEYYRFYDFRNLRDSFSKPPPLINNTQNASALPTWQDNIFDSDAWTTDWGVSSWTKPATEDAPVAMNNSKANVYIGSENNSSYLTLRTSRTKDYQTAAELENMQKNVMHVSMRMYARVVGAKGAVAGFFTYFDDDNECDIEILTDDPTNEIRYTNQPSVDKHGNVIEKASVAPTNLPAWDQWQLHRIDWLPKETVWYINSQQVAANSYNVPQKPSFMMMNMWSDGGVWSGNMTVGDSAELQIQWIDITFNTSGPYQGANHKRDLEHWESLEKRKTRRCGNVCAIDKVTDIGTPELVVSNNAPGMPVSWCHLWILAGLVSIVVMS